MGNKKQNLDLVTVCYDAEISLLALQARSIRLFADPSLIGTIYLVINEHNSRRTEKLITLTVLHEYGAFKERVRVLPYQALTKQRLRRAGWRSQQLLKLLISYHIQTDVYMVLDCKNHFIRALTAEKVWSKNGKLLSQENRIVNSFRGDYERACIYLGVDPIDEHSRTLPTVTPFVFLTPIVRDLIKYFEGAEGRPFTEIFMTGPRMTEFYLYVAYIQKISGDVKAHYDVSPRRTVSLMPGHTRNMSEVKNRLHHASHETVFSFGVHKRHIEKNIQETKDLVYSLWQKAGLIKTPDEGVAFWRIKRQNPFVRFMRHAMKLKRKLF